jgi:hypothetical protein
VLSGCARGVDSVAEAAAKERGLVVRRFPADWDSFGLSAGIRRNEEMAAAAAGLVAFWDGKSRGTAHMIAAARRRGLWVRVYGPDGEVIT